MEIEETTTVENNDCDFVDIGGAEQSLSHENRSWKFLTLFLFRLQKLSFSHKSVSFSFCFLYLFQNCFFCNLSCDETAIWLSILSSTVGYMLPNPKLK